MSDWSDEETDDPIHADRRNFYKVEKWSRDGQRVVDLVFAGTSLDKAKRIFDYIKALGKRVVADVIEIGARLSECKVLAGHGNWLPWLNREFGWSEDTAERYMRVSDLDKFRTVRNLDLPIKSLYLLTAPSTPEIAREAVLDLAANGETLTYAQVKDMIASGRTPSECQFE